MVMVMTMCIGILNIYDFGLLLNDYRNGGWYRFGNGCGWVVDVGVFVGMGNGFLYGCDCGYRYRYRYRYWCIGMG